MRKFLIFLLPIFLFSCQGSNINEQSTNSGELTTVEALSLSEIFEKIPESVSNEGEFRQCVQRNINSCIGEYNDRNTDISLDCSVFLGEEAQSICRENITILSAKESLNSDLCDGLTQSDMCMYEVTVQKGINSKDETVCNSIDSSQKIECNNLIVRSTAMETNDLNVCSKILEYSEGDTSEKDFCESMVKSSLPAEFVEEPTLEEQVTEGVDEFTQE